MNKIINIYKPVGKTPLQVIDNLRNKMPELRSVKIGYAGRLDPMARGVMILMIGDKTKERDRFLGLSKEYVFDVVFGIETDTFDIMGIVEKVNCDEFNEYCIDDFISKHLGPLEIVYPPFSSKAVKGKPLFWWSRNKRLHEIKIPKRKVEVFEFKKIESDEILGKDLENLVIKKIDAVEGDFRQEEIIKKWRKSLEGKEKEIFKTAKFRIRCSSGTYIRGLVNEMGNELGSGALALDIFRTQVGEYRIEDAIKI